MSLSLIAPLFRPARFLPLRAAGGQIPLDPPLGHRFCCRNLCSSLGFVQDPVKGRELNIKNSDLPIKVG